MAQCEWLTAVNHGSSCSSVPTMQCFHAATYLNLFTCQLIWPNRRNDKDMIPTQIQFRVRSAHVKLCFGVQRSWFCAVSFLSYRHLYV